MERTEPCWKEWLGILVFLALCWGAVYSLIF